MAEQWIEQLKQAVEQGYYRTESDEEGQSPLPSDLMELPLPDISSASPPRPWRDNLRRADLDLALKGYLESPDRQQSRFVPGLQVIAEDILTHDLRLVWANLWGRFEHSLAVSDWENGRLLLARQLYERRPFTIRCAIAGVLGAAALRSGDIYKGEEWASRRYGPITVWHRKEEG